MTTGLTADGFLAETFQSLREVVFGRLRNEFGNGLPLDDSTIEGHSWNILIDCLTKLWELAEAVYSSQDPDKATGAALEALCILTGTFRQPPSFGTGTTLFSGDAATLVPADTNIRIGDAGAIATTTDDATLAAADAWDTSLAYIIGDLVATGGNVYYCRADVDNTINAPTHTQRYPSGSLFLAGDPAIYWVWVGAGDAVIEVDAISVETGPVNFPSFAIDQIVNPIAGVSGVGNALDFELGQDIQSDESLRESRNNNLAAPGTSTRDSIRAAILALDDVVSCTVFVNNTMITDADGVPAKSIEVLVRGGDDQDIADCLLANVAAGIGTYGNTTASSVDSEGTAHTVLFSRPDEIAIYVALTLTYDAGVYPDDGDDEVALGVVTFGDLQKTGKDAVAQSIGATANALGIGVLEVTQCLISTTPGPVASTTIPISLRQLAVFDTSRISVTSNAGTP